MSKAIRFAAASALALALAGCAADVPQVLKPALVPDTFDGPVDASADVWPKPDWWQHFGNVELSTLVAQGQADNYDLAAAAARVMEVDSQATISRSALFPQINAQGIGARAGGSIGAVPALGQSNTQSTGNTFGLSLGATYEFDFWGLARDNLRAANETLKSARFSQQAVALAITANIADQYLTVLALR